MEREQSAYRHILRATGLFGSVQGVNILVGVVRNKCVAVLLGPAGMGLISLYNTATRLITDTAGMGLPMSGVREISVLYERGDHAALQARVALVRSWCLLAALAGALLCVLLAPLAGWLALGDGHTRDIMLLAPTVALTIIAGGEMAVLKGVRQLRGLARSSVVYMAFALATSVALFYVYGTAAILPVITLAAVLQLAAAGWYSYRLYPPRLSLGRDTLVAGLPLLRLGMAFVGAGIMGSSLEFAVRAWLSHSGGVDTVGLYNAGYMMTMTYGGMIFAAMETDYFPRLSAAGPDANALSLCVNRQAEVSLLLVSPFVILLMMFLPILLPLLFSGRFLGATAMMRVALPALCLRALALPVAYLPLARGDSRSYMLMEGLYDGGLLVLMIAAYTLWGLTGTGVALLAGGALDLTMLTLFTRGRYGYRLSLRSVRCLVVQGVLVAAALLLASYGEGPAYWVGGLLLAAASAGYSYRMITSANRPS